MRAAEHPDTPGGGSVGDRESSAGGNWPAGTQAAIIDADVYDSTLGVPNGASMVSPQAHGRAEKSYCEGRGVPSWGDAREAQAGAAKPRSHHGAC